MSYENNLPSCTKEPDRIIYLLAMCRYPLFCEILGVPTFFLYQLSLVCEVLLLILHDFELMVLGTDNQIKLPMVITLT